MSFLDAPALTPSAAAAKYQPLWKPGGRFPGFPCADNTRPTGSNNAPSMTTPQTSEIPHVVGFNTQELRFVYTNAYTDVTTQLDADGTSTLTVNASVRIGSTIYRITFNGRTSATIDPGGCVVSDPLPAALTKGTVFYSRTWVSGTQWYWNLANYAGGTAQAGGRVLTTDLTAPGSAAISPSAGYFYGPAAILGVPNANERFISVIGVGDSILAGLLDMGLFGSIAQVNPLVFGAGGYMNRAMRGQAGFVNAGISSDRAAQFVTLGGSFRRLVLSSAATHMVCEYGRNDIIDTVANVQASLIAVWLLGARRGLKVFQTTITPRTVSTDGWTSTAGQTPHDGPTQARLVQLNDWLRAGAPISSSLVPVSIGTPNALIAGNDNHPLSSYSSGTPVIEVADRIESARNSGLWKVENARAVTLSTTAGSQTVTGTGFTAGDVGKVVYIPGAGASGADLITTVDAFISATQITTKVAAATAVTNGQGRLANGMTTDGIHLIPYAAQLAASAFDISKF